MKILTTMMMAMCMTLSLSACESNTSENDPAIPETPQNPGGGDDNPPRWHMMKPMCNMAGTTAIWHFGRAVMIS